MRDPAGPTLAAVESRVHLLGAVELRGATAMRFAPERRFRLLVYLAVQGQWVSRNELAALFWPDRTQEAARSNLRKLLLEVRSLALPQFESERNAVRWAVASDVAQLRAAIGANDHGSVLALYRGPLAPDLDGGDSPSFTAWLTAERTRLHAAWRVAALSAMPGRTAAGALELAHLLLRDDPFDEEALRAALRALLALQRRADALKLYREFAERAAEELGVELSGDTRALAAALRDDVRAAAVAVAQAHDAGGFVGRANELDKLAEVFAGSACRLLTVTGPGGIGKSRLVRQALPRLEAHFADGALWVPLDDLNQAEAVAPRIVQLAALEPAPGVTPAEQVEAWLAPLGLLLVLDNAEHLPQLPALLVRWLGVAPRLRLLITSRQRLGLSDERLLPLSGLELPDRTDADAVAACDAGALFIRRACQQHPRFDGRRHGPAIARLVRAVGGMPLAIELAAGWVRFVPPAELADEVVSSTDLLQRADAGDERPEHRSLLATFELSWRLLAPAEQRAFAALSVFAGSFSRAAAKAVAGASTPVLAALADKSLLQADETNGDAPRFRLHPLLRQFAAAKLEIAGERRDLRARHARYFAQWLADAEQLLRGAAQPGALLQLELHLPDCRAAWAHALAARESAFVQQAALPLMYYYEARGWRADGVALFTAAEHAFAASPAGAVQATLARALSTLLYRNGDIALTIDAATRGIAAARTAGARGALKGCLLNLGLAEWQRGRWEPARRCFAEALALARDDRDVPGIGAFVNALAMVEQELGEYDDAETHYREALQVDRELRRPRGLASSLNNLAGLLLDRDRPADALPLLDEGLRLCSEHGITVMRAHFLLGLARARLALAQWPAAQDLAQQAARVADDGGEPHLAAEARILLARIALAGGAVEPSRQHAQQALRLAIALDNAPVLLNALCATAECLAATDDPESAAALWYFVSEHPQTCAVDRRRALALLAQAGLGEAERCACRMRAQRYELSTLAIDLARAEEQRTPTIPTADPR